jgi:membrane protease subunit HflC
MIVLAFIVAIGVASASVFTVDRSEYVYVTRLGRHTATYDGATQAGLCRRWPWPIESVRHIDRRMEVVDLPATEQLTRDASSQTIDRTLTVEGFVCWRIADAAGVDRFIRTVGTADRARTLLGQRITSQISAEIGKMQITDFVSDQRGRVAQEMSRLRERLLAQFHKSGANASMNDYGVEVVDIRLRRYNYPVEVRPAILDRIRSEREKKKAEYESEATIKVGRITADNDREVRQVAAQAEARRKQIRGEAEAEADRIRNQAFSKDSDFYVFLKKLEQYESILGNNRTVLLLSSHRDLFDLLFSPPRPGARPANGAAPTAKVDALLHPTANAAKNGKP